MLKIRLSMGGVRKRPVYKIVVADSRFPRDGRFVEKLGSFNPLLPKEKKERIKVESERIKYWISKGAKPTLRVSRILGEVNLFPMPKAGNNPLKAIPKKDRKKEAPKEGDKKEAPKEGDKKEAPKQEAKKEAPKQEAKKEAPKEGDKKEAPKQEAKKEAPKQEAKKEAPKQEAKKEAPKQEAKKEATKKEEAKGEKK
jgi:small subunit ribosomal protein S16